LIAVVDGTSGEAAIYQYDAVGNLLGIVRQPASTVAILNFTPKSGPVGTTVTISGTGYSATASQNTVTFNGTAATVSSATATQLVVTVPTGATTGPIAVTTPTGSVTSSTPFTVTSGGPLGAPTITSFTPTIGTAGTAVTISGTNYDPTPINDKVGFNVSQSFISSVTPTTLSVVVPSGTGSGKITVGTPLGTAVSATDFFVPPAPYTTAEVDSTGRIAFGETQSLTVSAANHIALLVFDGAANQKVSAWLRTTFVGCGTASATLAILNPDGTQLAAINTCTQNTTLLGPVSLPASGTYTLLLDPAGTNTGTATLTLYDVVDVTGGITPGGASVPVTLNTPGQRALLTFTGSSNQKVSAWLNPTAFVGCGTTSATLAILNPDGTQLAAISTCGQNTTFLGPVSLPASGTYTLLLDPAGTNTGTATLNLYDVVDVTGGITFGQTLMANLSTPGQRALWTFSGNATQRVSIVINTSTLGSCSSGNLSVLKPDGTTLASTGSVCTGVIWGPVVLPTTGTYTIVADPAGTTTGQVTVTLHEVVDVTGTLTIGAAPTPVTITTPTQTANLTFAGTASQQVTVRVTGNTISSVTVKLLKPDGTTQTSSTSSAANFNLTTQTVATTGTYTVMVDPPGVNTGSLNVQVTSP